MDTLLVMALAPALYLLWYVYKHDPVEKEPVKLLAILFGLGALACFPAIALETLGSEVILGGRTAYTINELLLENFIVIALSEELCKFVFLYLKTWKNSAFDYVFDGIVYAVFVSLGFAALENIGYVYEYGMSTAVVRSFTAVPGHAIFGVFMGCFYGLAKRAEHAGNTGQMFALLLAALVVPILGHGFYDFCASANNEAFALGFWVFLLVIMIIAMHLVKHMSKKAHPIFSAPSQTDTPANTQSGTPGNYSYGAPLDSSQYSPYVDNSLDGGAPTYTAPNQYGNSGAPMPPVSRPVQQNQTDNQGPFSKA
ncbi:MAG: PrsW family intramembrane metalloprotease [Eggerthellaceae bacterium]|nr:PrsW family intramembrane metalloprotease [Eggerthellaceae bacterium]